MTYRDYGDMRPLRWQIITGLRVARLFRWAPAPERKARKRTNELRRERNAAR